MCPNNALAIKALDELAELAGSTVAEGVAELKDTVAAAIGPAEEANQSLEDIPSGTLLRTPRGWGVTSIRRGKHDGAVGWVVDFWESFPEWYPDDQLTIIEWN